MNDAIEQLRNTYRESALRHGEATLAGDAAAANTSHDALVASLIQLRKHGEDGMAALLTLLEDGSPSVRCWAATHSLPVNEARGRAVLHEVAARSDILGLAAQTVLAEWNAGTLELP